MEIRLCFSNPEEIMRGELFITLLREAARKQNRWKAVPGARKDTRGAKA